MEAEWILIVCCLVALVSISVAIVACIRGMKIPCGLALIIFGLMALTISSFTEDKQEDIKLRTEMLVSLQDNSKVAGSIRGSGSLFYLTIRGGVDQKTIYVGYLKKGEEYMMRTYSSDSTIVYTDKDYRVEYWGDKTKQISIKIFGLFEVINSTTKKSTRYVKIYVPKGSIVEEFKLDANL